MPHEHSSGIPFYLEAQALSAERKALIKQGLWPPKEGLMVWRDSVLARLEAEHRKEEGG